MTQAPIAVFYEHPDWFKPLFAELDTRGIDYEKRHLKGHFFDPCLQTRSNRLVVNRVSAYPSVASTPRVVLYVKQYLAHLENIGVRVINGRHAYEVGTSKALQMNIFNKIGLRTPKSRVIHEPRDAIHASKGLRFPILIKPNVGGSGAGIVLYKNQGELAAAVDSGGIDLGIDGVALVQEYLPPKDDCIYRVEILNDAFLYAIRLPIVAESFNYCPADGCNVERFDYCPVGGVGGNSSASPTSHIRSFQPTPEVIESVRRTVSESGADIGGVEYLVNADDDQIYFYDINPLSNFVADAPRIVGFDPVSRFVDFILQQGGR